MGSSASDATRLASQRPRPPFVVLGRFSVGQDTGELWVGVPLTICDPNPVVHEDPPGVIGGALGSNCRLNVHSLPLTHEANMPFQAEGIRIRQPTLAASPVLKFGDHHVAGCCPVLPS